jgi:DNA polymerase III delta subunit
MSSVILIYGDDEYLVSRKGREVVDGLVPSAVRDTQLDVVSADVTTGDEAVAAIRATCGALQSLGLFSSEKTVWLKGATFLRESRVGRTVAVKEALPALVDLIKRGLTAGTHLVVTADGAHKGRAFFKACKAVGEIHEFALPSSPFQVDKYARSTLASLVRERGLSMDGSASELFLSKVGTDTRQMVSELEKLETYLGRGGSVRVDDIDAITSTSREAAGWDLADAYAKRDLTECLRLLEQLIFQKVAPIAMIVGIENRLRELLVYRTGLSLGWLDQRGSRASWGTLPPAGEEVFSAQMRTDPRAIHPFRIGLLAGQAGNFTIAELTAALEAATRTHELMVSTANDPKSILTRLLVSTLRRV